MKDWEKEYALEGLNLVLKCIEEGRMQAGICETLSWSNAKYPITTRNYVLDNRPWNFRRVFMWMWPDYAYYWPMGKREPRIKWLKKHIKKLEREVDKIHSYSRKKRMDGRNIYFTLQRRRMAML